MPRHEKAEEKEQCYFITFTCYKWLNLIELSDSYGSFYKWLDHLISQTVKVLGFVIMPNHFHGILYIPETCPKTLNQLVSNGKRFISYDIVKNLKLKGEDSVLDLLTIGLTDRELRNKQRHKVFKASFDFKYLDNSSVCEIKLNYIHRNPTSGKWNLGDNYQHSSKSFYEQNTPSNWLLHYKDYV